MMHLWKFPLSEPSYLQALFAQQDIFSSHTPAARAESVVITGMISHHHRWAVHSGLLLQAKSIESVEKGLKQLLLAHSLNQVGTLQQCPSNVAGGGNAVLTQAPPHAQAFANRHTSSAAPTPSAAVTAVPVAQQHAATGTLGNPLTAVDHHLGARHQQQQTPTHQTDQDAAAYPASAGSSPQLRSHRHQGPIWWRPSAAERLSRSITARNSHAGSTATVGAGSPAQSPAPLQPVVTQSLRSSATPPRSPLISHPSPSPASPRAAHAPDLNAASSAVRSRAASSDTSLSSSETRAAANSPRAIANRSVAPARRPATSAYLPGFPAGFLVSAAHRPTPAARRAASPTLPDRLTSRQASSSEQAAVHQATGALLSCSWICCVLSVDYHYTSANMLYSQSLSAPSHPDTLHVALALAVVTVELFALEFCCLLSHSMTAIPCR